MKARRRTIHGEEHEVIVLKITSRDGLGRPKTADIGFPDTTFDLKGGEEFMTAWVPSKVLAKRPS